MRLRRNIRLRRKIMSPLSLMMPVAVLTSVALSIHSAQAGIRGPTVPEDYAAMLRARSQVAQLDAADMFGDRIGPFTGSVEFLQTDVDLPGNNALEVSIRRRLVAGTQGRQGLGMFDTWDLALPSVHATFSTQGGWRNFSSNEPLNRCSKFTEPPSETVTVTVQVAGGPRTMSKDYRPNEFWHGTLLYMPDTGEEDLLVRSNDWPVPATGHDYPLRTKSGNVVRCIPMGDANGEGFEVTTPAGITYTLNHMAKGVSGVPLIKPGTAVGNLGSITKFEYIMFRQEFFMLPTSARDGHGNTVTYSWDTTNPRQLNRIESSDGRTLDLIWSNGNVSEVRHGTRTWTYGNAIGGYKITLPDQSFWQITGFNVGMMGSGSVPAERGFCRNPGVITYGHSGSVRHPSGALATYEFEPVLHGRSSAPYICDMADSMQSTSMYSESIETTPSKYYTWSIISKTVTGPGIDQPHVWTYAYSPADGCYSTGAKELCQANSSTTKQTDITSPDGVVERHTFSTRYGVDEGHLLSTVAPSRTTRFSYQLDTPGSYPSLAGYPTYQRAVGILSAKLIPLAEKTIEQDSIRHSWRVNNYDSMARPVSITTSSEPIP